MQSPDPDPRDDGSPEPAPVPARKEPGVPTPIKEPDQPSAGKG